MMAIPFDAIQTWLFDAALPLWAEASVDRRRGGFYEALTPAAAPMVKGFKRTRVAARQTYVFSHAFELGWVAGLEISTHGYESLVRLYRGPDKGWPRSVTDDFAPLDDTPDLYDLAFALFAFAWRYRVSRDTEALAYAHRVVDFIEAHMRAPAGGFWHAHPPAGARQQNPHMHLLEAALVAAEASTEARFRDLADELVSLFMSRFFDGATLAELFTDALARAPGEAGRIIEPGHHFEWAWILKEYGFLVRRDMSEPVQKLTAFAERFGVDATAQRTFQTVRDDGAPLDRGTRVWPHAERIKAHLANFEMSGRDPTRAVAGSVAWLLSRHLATLPQGLWVEHLDAKGRPARGEVPTSTLYHLTLAFAETLRLRTRLAQR